MGKWHTKLNLQWILNMRGNVPFVPGQSSVEHSQLPLEQLLKMQMKLEFRFTLQIITERYASQYMYRFIDVFYPKCFSLFFTIIYILKNFYLYLYSAIQNVRRHPLFADNFDLASSFNLGSQVFNWFFFHENSYSIVISYHLLQSLT